MLGSRARLSSAAPRLGLSALAGHALDGTQEASGSERLPLTQRETNITDRLGSNFWPEQRAMRRQPLQIWQIWGLVFCRMAKDKT